MAGHPTDTIAALSTPAGESGIAVIRMSGPDALAVLDRLYRTSPGNAAAAHPPPRQRWQHQRIYHGYLMDGEDWVDEVMCAVMCGPDTYTGEDTVEISCHGNALLVARILELLYRNGARAAEAGEFTRRAFVNGKMDLVQAEAVGELIHARSALQQEVAREKLAGELSRRLNVLADDMVGLLGLIEANIDFIEDGIDTLDVDGSVAMLDRHEQELDALLRCAEMTRPFHEGYRVAIIGPVNAGKSCLFNRLVGENRAIVTEVAGTTRDVLREPIVVDGLLFILHDTAGLRRTVDQVEAIGVGMARSAAAAADIVLFVIDASAPVLEDTRRDLEAASDDAVVVLNKVDRPVHPTVQSVAGSRRVVETSALDGRGLDMLREALIDGVGRERLNWIARERIVLNARLAATLRECREPLDSLRNGLRGRAPLEILAVDARACLGHYEQATGKRYSDQLLDVIFARFCIGK